MITIEGYTITLVKNMEGILFLDILTPENKTYREIRYLTYNTKGIYKTSVYGMKIKVNVNNNTIAQ